MEDVHCRVGSLENLCLFVSNFRYVHCRVGSLKTELQEQLK